MSLGEKAEATVLKHKDTSLISSHKTGLASLQEHNETYFQVLGHIMDQVSAVWQWWLEVVESEVTMTCKDCNQRTTGSIAEQYTYSPGFRLLARLFSFWREEMLDHNVNTPKIQALLNSTMWLLLMSMK